jgi:hypothetical protein
MVGEEQELPYRIEMWDEHDSRIEELIALVADHAVARAAFTEAVRRASRQGHYPSAEVESAGGQPKTKLTLMSGLHQ